MTTLSILEMGLVLIEWKGFIVLETEKIEKDSEFGFYWIEYHSFTCLREVLNGNYHAYCHTYFSVRANTPFEDDPITNLHQGMFIPTLMMQGTEATKPLLKKAMEFKILGTYAQTELGHGRSKTERKKKMKKETGLHWKTQTDSWYRTFPLKYCSWGPFNDIEQRSSEGGVFCG